MKVLCDSNVFIALALEAHPNHEIAVAWVWKLNVGARLLFCRATQTSFLRLLTVVEVMKEHVCSHEKAIETYRLLRSDARVDLVEEPRGVEAQWMEYAALKKSSPKLWMDAYLAAFARCAGLKFATFDRGFGKYAGLELVSLGR
jgi:uncharacterized protein